MSAKNIEGRHHPHFIDEKMSHGRDRKPMWLVNSGTGTPTQAPELTTLKYYAILPLTEIQRRINM